MQPPERFAPQLVALCAAAGAAVVFTPQLPRARVSGAARWLTPEKALLQLSPRYKTGDHLWFSFLHEAGHILLHGKQDFFLETAGDDETEKEKEADRFAADLLIPPEKLQAFLDSWTPGRYPGAGDVLAFAGRIVVAPGIVAGRLQHDGHVPFTHFNDFKQRLAWAGELE